MQTGNPAVRERTGYALFDDRQVLVDANAEIFGGMRPPAATSRKWTSSPSSPKSSRISNASTAWPSSRRTSSRGTRRAAGGKATCCRSRRRPSTGDWKLLTSHPRPDGGVALVSTDITEMKRAQIAHLENAEIFRCITDSHPLPVWVVDEESKQILYESLDASNLLGREWRPRRAAVHDRPFHRPGRIRGNRDRSPASTKSCATTKSSSGEPMDPSSGARRTAGAASIAGDRRWSSACSTSPSASSARICSAS